MQGLQAVRDPGHRQGEGGLRPAVLPDPRAVTSAEAKPVRGDGAALADARSGWMRKGSSWRNKAPLYVSFEA